MDTDQAASPFKGEALEIFERESNTRIEQYRANDELKRLSKVMFDALGYDRAKYVYNFFWTGVPIIQLPQDIQLKQELIWEVGPDYIIETGIAWAGSLLFSRSMQILLEYTGRTADSIVIGVDIDIRTHTRQILENHPLADKIFWIEGSSTEQKTLEQISRKITLNDDRKGMVFLDSDHSHRHVLEELKLYSRFVSIGSYIVVDDTSIEFHGKGDHRGGRWAPQNSPYSAIQEFLKTDDGQKFAICEALTEKLLLTGMPSGVLKRIS
jgi:cephalosporin hydroxylase